MPAASAASTSTRVGGEELAGRARTSRSAAASRAASFSAVDADARRAAAAFARRPSSDDGGGRGHAGECTSGPVRYRPGIAARPSVWPFGRGEAVSLPAAALPDWAQRPRRPGLTFLPLLADRRSPPKRTLPPPVGDES